MDDEQRFWSKVDKHGKNECWIWMFARTVSRLKYGVFRLKGKAQKAHRVAFELWWGVDLPEWLCVLHECDNPPCCNPAHLWIGTRAANNRDCKEKGRLVLGSRNYNAKLDELSACGVMARLLQGASQSTVAKEFGVGACVVGEIWRCRNWKSVFGLVADDVERHSSVGDEKGVKIA